MMTDKRFKAYQEQRQKAERAVREYLVSWAMENCHQDTTLGEIRVLEGDIVSLMNHHMRQAYDIGAAHPDTLTE